MLPTFYDPMPDFSAINRSLAWATDSTLPKMLDDVFRTVISHLDDDTPLVVVAYEALNNITGYNKRLNVAYRLQDKLMEYLKSFKGGNLLFHTISLALLIFLVTFAVRTHTIYS